MAKDRGRSNITPVLYREMWTTPCNILFSTPEWSDLVVRLGFTRRQLQLVGLLIQGRTDYEMANELGISRNTVRAHFQRIFISQQVTDRTALIVAVFRAFRET